MTQLVSVKLSEEASLRGARGSVPALSALLDEELAQYEAWFSKTMGAGLTRFEKAALKSYIFHKATGNVGALKEDIDHDTP